MTVTPAKPQGCPAENSDLIFDTEIFIRDQSAEDKAQYILDYLNQGGSIQPILEKLEYELNTKHGYRRAYYGDLNGDNIPELFLMFSGILPHTFELIGCVNGEYENLYMIDLGGMVYVDILMINDINLDGLPEVVLMMKPYLGMSYWLGYQILGWDGSSFQSLVSQTEFDGLNSLGGVQWEWIRMPGLGSQSPWDGDSWEIKDIDQNGTWELIIRGGIETSWDFIRHGPYQPVTQIFMWNGEGFVMDDLQVGPPEYRFQAVQNGDLYTLMHKYGRANEAYRQAIDDPNLAWWSEESEAFINAKLDAKFGEFPTPTMSAPDKNEYPNLAAYAHYRIFLLHVLQGQLPEAEEAYQAIQAQYFAEETGYIYGQIAKIFWGEYQASEDIHSACAEVVDYAAMHQDEVLRYIGGYHGWQSLDYDVTDICPFR